MLYNDTPLFPTDIDKLIFFQDVNLDTLDIMNRFQSLVSSGKYSESSEYINSQSDSGIHAMVASLFNLIENEIKSIQDYLLEIVKTNPISCGDTEPVNTDEQYIWIEENIIGDL